MLLGCTLLGLAAALASACGGGDDAGGAGGSGNSGGSAASGTGGSSAGSNGGSGGITGGSGGVLIDSGSGGSGGSNLPDGGECAADTHTGELVPLDLYVMLDRSGSMTDTTAAGPTKWDAIKQALTSFVNDPGSAGTGVGLQYFPLNKQGVPDSCTNSSQCGAGGPCLLKSCNQGGSIQPCNTTADCPGLFNQCVDLGYCTGDPNIYCLPVGHPTVCGSAGQCAKLTTSSCADATSCLVGDYTNPAVPIALLPGNASALAASINAQTPWGGTPTGPALQGAIDQAKAYNQQNPTHRVAVVLATDGLPTACNPTDIQQIAALAGSAYNASPSIVTFVIGVFGPNDSGAQQNLNSIAQAGGSSSAFMVDTSGNVTQQFLAALDQIKGSALACEFQVPTPEAGTLDYQKVNIDVETPSGTQKLFYVEDASKCDPQNGGWYYDIPPSQGTPTKIIVCPSTCDAFKQTTNAKVKILVGCQTVTPPPA